MSADDSDSSGFSLATAHAAWDARWRTEAGRADWLEPEPEVGASIERLRTRGARCALDLGCGVGRHALLLAGAGFEVIGADASVAGLRFARDRAHAAGLDIRWVSSSFIDLPLETRSLDFVLTWNVIYHGGATVVRRALQEIARVLQPGGLLLATMLSKRNHLYGQGARVAENTFVAETEDEEKRHPHFYCDARELVHLFGAFEVLALHDRETAKPGSHHWVCLAEKPATASV